MNPALYPLSQMNLNPNIIHNPLQNIQPNFNHNPLHLSHAYPGQSQQESNSTLEPESAPQTSLDKNFILIDHCYDTQQTLLPQGMTSINTTGKTWYSFKGQFILQTLGFIAIGFENSTNIITIHYTMCSNNTTRMMTSIKNTEITSFQRGDQVWFTVNGTFSTGPGAGTFGPTIQISDSCKILVGSFFSVESLGPTGNNLNVGFC
jgi:hypothetical protein